MNDLLLGYVALELTLTINIISNNLYKSNCVNLNLCEMPQGIILTSSSYLQTSPRPGHLSDPECRPFLSNLLFELIPQPVNSHHSYSDFADPPFLWFQGRNILLR